MPTLSARETASLIAVAEAAIPAGRFVPAAGAATVDKVVEFLAHTPALLGGYRALLAGLDGAAWLHHRRPLTRLTPEARVALLQRWRRAGLGRRTAVRALVTPLKVAHFDDPALYRALGCAYQFEAPAGEARSAYLRQRVHDAGALTEDPQLECDVVVVGTGAGGAVVGKELAEAGLAVILVEEGRYFDRTDFTGRPFAAQRAMYRRAGATVAVGNTVIPIPVGRTVGGSTTINSGTCYRAPDRVLRAWQHELGLGPLGPDQLAPHYDRVEAVLGVAPARAEFLGGNARVIARGCDALGLRAHHPLRRNAPDCDGKGVCCFGCPTDAKRSTNVSYVPLALRAGAELFTGARVEQVRLEAGRATGVVARTAAGVAVTIRARAVVIAAGALETPRLLARQGLGAGSSQLGRNLSIHPATGLLAEFDEPITGWDGIPQGYAIEDLHDEGILFEGAATPLEMTMSQVQEVGPALTALAEGFDRVATFGFMVEDSSRGVVRAGEPAITYWLGDADLARLKRGVDVLARVFFAAGARVVWTPVAGFERLTSVDQLGALRAAHVRASDLDLSAYHPLGTARMGVDPQRSVVGLDHQVHDTPGLYVIDGAAVPTSLGVNPQVTIMALATRAAGLLAATLTG